MANYNWLCRTLPFGIYYQIWTQETLRHILDLFWSFLKYVNLKMMIPVLLFDTFTKGYSILIIEVLHQESLEV